MPYPRDLPRELARLWKVQYEPREKILFNQWTSEGDKKSKKIYEKFTYIQKISFIDNLQQRGVFD